MAFRCRHGWHSWRFISMSNRRDIDTQVGTYYVCCLVEECRRCGLKRTRDSAPVPKRVRV